MQNPNWTKLSENIISVHYALHRLELRLSAETGLRGEGIKEGRGALLKKHPFHVLLIEMV
jgi:hypothetical protein